MAQNGNALGYVMIEGEDGQFRGAALVVDMRGIPVDFRYTDPIRPTRLERILYGNALEVYLREELILQSLMSAVESKPQLWICAEEDLILPLKNISRTKTVCISASSHSPLEAAGSIEPADAADAYFVQADSVSAPLRVTFSAGARQDEVQQTASAMSDAAATMELLEPFGRIQKALASLAEE